MELSTTLASDSKPVAANTCSTFEHCTLDFADFFFSHRRLPFQTTDQMKVVVVEPCKKRPWKIMIGA
jgi:copper oxidase (laccase) domain-containing protein